MYLPCLRSPLIIVNIWVIIVKLWSSTINTQSLCLVGQIFHQPVFHGRTAKTLLINLKRPLLRNIPSISIHSCFSILFRFPILLHISLCSVSRHWSTLSLTLSPHLLMSLHNNHLCILSNRVWIPQPVPTVLQTDLQRFLKLVHKSFQFRFHIF